MKFIFWNIAILLEIVTLSKGEGISLDLATSRRQRKSHIDFDIHQRSDAFPALKSVKSGVDIDLVDVDDIVYKVEVEIGTPPQSFSLIVDTGSSDMWVLGPGTASEVSGVPIFDSDKSQSFTDLNEDVQLAFLTGEATGTAGEDIVQLGELTAEDQTLVLVQDIDQDFQDQIGQSEFEGIVGMAFRGAAQDKAATLIETLFKQGEISEFKFSFDLKDNPKKSRLILGEPDESLITNGLTNLDVVGLSPGEQFDVWVTELEGVHVGSTTLTSGKTLAIFDTGTSVLLGPQDHVARLVTVIQSKIGSTVECGTIPDTTALACIDDNMFSTKTGNDIINSMPSIQFTFNGKTFSVPPNKYALPLDGFPAAQLLIGALEGDDTWLLGDPFLRSHYTIYEIPDGNESKAQVILANQPPGSQISTVAIIAIVVAAIALVIVSVCCYKRMNRPVPADNYLIMDGQQQPTRAAVPDTAVRFN